MVSHTQDHINSHSMYHRVLLVVSLYYCLVIMFLTSILFSTPHQQDPLVFSKVDSLIPR